jgi:hypothetical protein
MSQTVQTYKLDKNGIAYLPLPVGFKYGAEKFNPKENFRPDGSFRLDFPGVIDMVNIGGILKVSGPLGEEIAGKLLGTHNNGGNNSGSYVMGIRLDGSRIRLRKEIHNTYTETLLKSTPKLGDLRDKYIGVQFFKFNFLDTKSVGLAAHVDLDPLDENDQPKNNWVQKFGCSDTGSFEVENRFKKPWFEPSVKGKGQNTLRVDEQERDTFGFKYVFCRTILSTAIPKPPICKDDFHYDYNLNKCVPNVVPVGETDENGVRYGTLKRTGNSVTLLYGSRHRNGDRYNVNHHFQNYYAFGYFLLGKDQNVLEMKTDGPNHSKCTKGLRCQWVELDFAVQPHKGAKRGQGYISSEYPHPVNHDPVWKDVESVTIDEDFRGKWVGFGVLAQWTPEGFRLYEEYLDKGGLIDGKTPANDWVRTLRCINTGQIMPNPKRPLPIEGRGLEAEFRMNNGVNTEMKYGKVVEIQI